AADHDAGGRRAQQTPEQIAADRADHIDAEDGERVERVEKAAPVDVRAVRCLRLRRRQWLTIDDGDDAVDALGNAAGKIAGAEIRRDHLVDDAPRCHVGEAALEPIADLDTQPVVILGNDKQRAIVDLLASDLPGLRGPDRELLDGFGLCGRYDQDRDLAALAALQVLQLGVQRVDIALGERPGLIDHAPGQGRHGDVGRRDTGPAEEQCNEDGPERGHRASYYFDGAGLKSTFGAVEISFSLSTVKFGFSL